VAISLSPTWFFNRRDMLDRAAYAGNFSRQHASELAFSQQLSLAFKQDAARRMLQDTDTLNQDPLLRFALEQLASGSGPSQLLYYAVFPLGKLQNLSLLLQDHWQSLVFIWGHREMSPAPGQPSELDWASILRGAEVETQQTSNNNPYGFANDVWDNNADRLDDQENSRSEDSFVRSLVQSTEWTDLELLLRGMRQLGAEPLILSMPIKGVYYEYLGISAQARKVFYRRLATLAGSYGVPLLSFSDWDQDRYFLIDPGAHLSSKGWVYYDQALDTFYHGGLR